MHRRGSEDEEEEKESPEMILAVAIGTLVAATGLTCKLPFPSPPFPHHSIKPY